VWGTQ